MNPRFDPLLKSSGDAPSNKQSFKLKIVPSGEVKLPFKSLASAMSEAGGGIGRSTGGAPADHEHEPRVDLKRDGETVTRITVTCGCGGIMEIECEYADAAVGNE